MIFLSGLMLMSTPWAWASDGANAADSANRTNKARQVERYRDMGRASCEREVGEGVWPAKVSGPCTQVPDTLGDRICTNFRDRPLRSSSLRRFGRVNSSAFYRYN